LFFPSPLLPNNSFSPQAVLRVFFLFSFLFRRSLAWAYQVSFHVAFCIPFSFFSPDGSVDVFFFPRLFLLGLYVPSAPRRHLSAVPLPPFWSIVRVLFHPSPKAVFEFVIIFYPLLGPMRSRVRFTPFLDSPPPLVPWGRALLDFVSPLGRVVDLASLFSPLSSNLRSTHSDLFLINGPFFFPPPLSALNLVLACPPDVCP